MISYNKVKTGDKKSVVFDTAPHLWEEAGGCIFEPATSNSFQYSITENEITFKTAFVLENQTGMELAVKVKHWEQVQRAWRCEPMLQV